jgi:hypothetical protein
VQGGAMPDNITSNIIHHVDPWPLRSRLAPATPGERMGFAARLD